MIIGGLETGGITCRVSIAHSSSPESIVCCKTIPNGDPKRTLKIACDWLNEQGIQKLGVASFGPIDIDEKSKTYGYIKSTPKKGWRDFNLLGYIRSALTNGSTIPIGFQTDVNAACLAESLTPKHLGKQTCVYITVGGGVGVGIVQNKKPLQGLSHGEGGHIKTAKYEVNGKEDSFSGTCSFHGNCIEGLISAGAIAERLSIKENELPYVPEDHEVWNVFSFYLGQLAASLTLTLFPNVIVVSGGVLKRKSLFPKIRSEVLKFLAGYIQLEQITEKIDSYIVPEQFEGTAGVVGSLRLAAFACK